MIKRYFRQLRFHFETSNFLSQSLKNLFELKGTGNCVNKLKLSKNDAAKVIFHSQFFSNFYKMLHPSIRILSVLLSFNFFKPLNFELLPLLLPLLTGLPHVIFFDNATTDPRNSSSSLLRGAGSTWSSSSSSCLDVSLSSCR